MMGRYTVITELGATDVDAVVSQGRFLVEPGVLDATLGWRVEPRGLCRGDVCVPLQPSDATRLGPDRDGRIDLQVVAHALARPTLLDDEARVLVVGASAADRRVALRGRQLPLFELPDLDGVIHSSSRWRGHKRLLVAFASW